MPKGNSLMATQQLQRSEWKHYFDTVSKILVGKHAEINIAGRQLGDQIQREWSLLNGLVYDPKDDLFEVIIEDEVDHLVFHPKEIWVDQAGVMLQSVDVVDADGNHQIVLLKEPLPLPPPD